MSDSKFRVDWYTNSEKNSFCYDTQELADRHAKDMNAWGYSTKSFTANGAASKSYDVIHRRPTDVVCPDTKTWTEGERFFAFVQCVIYNEVSEKGWFEDIRTIKFPNGMEVTNAFDKEHFKKAVAEMLCEKHTHYIVEFDTDRTYYSVKESLWHI